MKYRFSIVLIVLSLLLALVSVAAAPMPSGRVTLIGVNTVPGKGVVFTFHVDGNYSKSELKGSVRMGGVTYGLDCVQVDESTVKCTANKAIAGANVAVSWGGSTFWTDVPNLPTPLTQTSQYCYSIWDYYDFTDMEWTDFGPHCQDEPAQAFDEIEYTTEGPDGTYEGWAEFYDVDVSGECESPVPYNGPAYYFPYCPEDILD